uniref:Uncharacterized protein n=1 Tax=Oryza rufipogon TaxID=4529 RepID=A0A0E0Q7H4_ORYRU
MCHLHRAYKLSLLQIIMRDHAHSVMKSGLPGDGSLLLETNLGKSLVLVRCLNLNAELFGSMWYKWITYTGNGRLVVWKGHLHENFYGDLQIRLILIDELGTKMETIVFRRQAEHLN